MKEYYNHTSFASLDFQNGFADLKSDIERINPEKEYKMNLNLGLNSQEY